MKQIPYARQSISEEDIQAVVDVLRSDWLTQGPMVPAFEKRLAEYCGAKYVVVFNSGTAALHAAYFAAGLKKGEEVITSPITFAATANAALYLGGRPVFVDIAPDSFSIDISKIETAITPNTKIIAPVDMAGIPVDIDTVMQIAAKHNLVVVEDAAHALGAVYKGKPVGASAHMTVFSFHPVKHITTGEGGAVATNVAGYYEELRLFRSHGITKNRERLIKKDEGPWHQEMQLLGFNYRLTDIQCALGLSQLKKLDRFLYRRREIAARYNEAFHECASISIPPLIEDSNSAWHIYVIRLNEGLDREKVALQLKDNGIVTQLHYIPVYRHPYYSELNESGYSPENYPNAEDYYRRALTIPLFYGLNDLDVKHVICVLMSILK